MRQAHLTVCENPKRLESIVPGRWDPKKIAPSKRQQQNRLMRWSCSVLWIRCLPNHKTPVGRAPPLALYISRITLCPASRWLHHIVCGWHRSVRMLQVGKHPDKLLPLDTSQIRLPKQSAEATATQLKIEYTKLRRIPCAGSLKIASI